MAHNERNTKSKFGILVAPANIIHHYFVNVNSSTMAKDSNKRAREVDEAEVVVCDVNPPSTLSEIQERIKQLIDRIPSKEATAALTLDDIPAMERWCKTVRKITRDYNLSLNFVAIANYQWEPDRPGKKWRRRELSDLCIIYK